MLQGYHPRQLLWSVSQIDVQYIVHGFLVVTYNKREHQCDNYLVHQFISHIVCVLGGEGLYACMPSELIMMRKGERFTLSFDGWYQHSTKTTP